ncbi:MAG: ribulose-phosphate 3-epimerase [Deltaproteobacteria bacterium]|nr:ribulose-phosphate 3-epimerase [Deltaproteobacteria bacterium]
MDYYIAPSLLSADFGRLAEEIQAIEKAGADLLHVDVMDGRFVPNITIGPFVVAAMKRCATVPLDVHLMIVEPERYIDSFSEAGADVITIHAEATPHLQRAVARIRELGRKAGVALNPSTPLSAVEWVLQDVDMVLIMSVNPGFGGQAFLPASLGKIELLRSQIRRAKLDVDIQVDGGIKADNVGEVAAAGANVIVSGSGIFGTPNCKETIGLMRRNIRSAVGLEA